MGSRCCLQHIDQRGIQKHLPAIQSSNTTKKQENRQNISIQQFKWPNQSAIVLPDGSRYSGNLKNGVSHGFGTQWNRSGDIYMGNFYQGTKMGQGEYLFQNGIKYKGQFKNGNLEGKGRIQWPTGDWYEGLFKNNIINGYGRYYLKNTNSLYQGNYRDGKRHGKGKLTAQNSILQGQWENGQFRYNSMADCQVQSQL